MFFNVSDEGLCTCSDCIQLFRNFAAFLHHESGGVVVSSELFQNVFRLDFGIFDGSCQLFQFGQQFGAVSFEGACVGLQLFKGILKLVCGRGKIFKEGFRFVFPTFHVAVCGCDQVLAFANHAVKLLTVGIFFDGVEQGESCFESCIEFGEGGVQSLIEESIKNRILGCVDCIGGAEMDADFVVAEESDCRKGEFRILVRLLSLHWGCWE